MRCFIGDKEIVISEKEILEILWDYLVKKDPEILSYDYAKFKYKFCWDNHPHVSITNLTLILKKQNQKG